MRGRDRCAPHSVPPGMQIWLGVRRAAPDAYVRPKFWRIERLGAAEIEFPTVNAEARTETAVDAAQQPHQEREEPLIAEGEQRDLTRRRRGKVVCIEEGKPARQILVAAMACARVPLDVRHDLARRMERIHMAAAAPQPPVDAVSERPGVRDGDIQRSIGLENTTDFAQRDFEAGEVFQTMVAHDEVECAGAKRELRGVCCNPSARLMDRRRREIDPHQNDIRAKTLETAAACP